MKLLPPTLQFSPATLPDAKIGEAYSQEIIISNGLAPYNCAPMNDVPLGLTWTRNADGMLTLVGTPIQQPIIDFPIVIQVTDSNNATLTINY